jgi:hypothetical protein
MKYTQQVPEGWTVENELSWQDLCEEVDTYEYAAYTATGGLREFDSWRERELTEGELAVCSMRHPSTWAEVQTRPTGPVDTWVPSGLPFDDQRFRR